MSPEAQRIAIAEACGWRFSPMADASSKPVAIMCWIAPGDGYWHMRELPDYLNDLNACHEMEKVLRPPNQPTWNLWEDYCRRIEDDPHATAAQRGEKFLRTLNLWKP